MGSRDDAKALAEGQRASRSAIPVWDYALTTEPLSKSQLESLGWRNRPRAAGFLGVRIHGHGIGRIPIWGAGGTRPARSPRGAQFCAQALCSVASRADPRIAVQLTQRGLARADENEGRRGLWLRMLDWADLGFDS